MNRRKKCICGRWVQWKEEKGYIVSCKRCNRIYVVEVDRYLRFSIREVES
jgi:hypothetical protein